jgi:hypothetical protein
MDVSLGKINIRLEWGCGERKSYRREGLLNNNIGASL